MNINPNAIKILCYGDSNTWGYIPVTKQRYPVGVRWTGVLQQKLGQEYWIIEEGLNSRTTDLDDPTKPGKNGFAYLRPCLETHNPIDIIVLMLGTNDMKERFQREPKDIAGGIEKLILEIRTTALNDQGKAPKVILISPPLVDGSVAGVDEKYKGADQKSKQLAALYRKIAQEYDLEFIDCTQHASPSKKDGYHFEPEGHAALAQAIFEKITTIIA